MLLLSFCLVEVVASDASNMTADEETSTEKVGGKGSLPVVGGEGGGGKEQDPPPVKEAPEEEDDWNDMCGNTSRVKRGRPMFYDPRGWKTPGEFSSSSIKHGGMTPSRRHLCHPSAAICQHARPAPPPRVIRGAQHPHDHASRLPHKACSSSCPCPLLPTDPSAHTITHNVVLRERCMNIQTQS